MVAGYGSSDFIRMRLKDPRLSNTMDCHDFRGWSSWNLQVTFVLQAAPRLTSKILTQPFFIFFGSNGRRGSRQLAVKDFGVIKEDEEVDNEVIFSP